MKRYYTLCWKCENKINSQADCNYVKTRDGNYSLCPACYDFFLNHNISVFRPERSKREELERSLHRALSDFHDEALKHEGSIRFSGGLKGGQELPSVLIHQKGFWFECDACNEILSMRCSEHCGNTVREAQ